jgi:hypothetical protein
MMSVVVDTVGAKPATPQEVKVVNQIVRVDEPHPKVLAKRLLTKKQFQCLDKLLIRESQWTVTSKNPKSSAKGIGQLLDATRRNLGMEPKKKDGTAQLVATLSYIHRRHVNPCNAWRFFSEHRYY